MKDSNYAKKIFSGQSGFSFIEISVVLIIIGILTGAGMLLFGKTLESGQRKQTLERLKASKDALLLFAENRGQLPLSDASYYTLIGSSMVDVWNQPISYKVSENVDAALSAAFDPALCGKLKKPTTASNWLTYNDTEINGLDYKADGTGERAAVALLLSGGARDADGNEADGALRFFDGGNATGPYVRKYPAENFDDIVVAITADEMYNAIRDNFCMATVTVTDSRAIGDYYYIYNRTAAKDIGSANWPETITAKVLFGEQIEIRDASGGGGNLIPANVPLPVTIIANPTAISTLP